MRSPFLRNRYLQVMNPATEFFSFITRPLTSAIETVFPFFRPNQYPLQPIDSFVIHFVCTDINRVGCTPQNTIVFTTAENPPPNGFRYHNTGPPSLQGVFWTQQNTLTNFFGGDADSIIPASQLVSFARTRHGNGVQTGVLQRDANGYDFVARVLGDHSWGFRQNVVDTFASASDSLYLFQLTEGTLENPLRFEIFLSFKLWFNCLRYNFRELINGTYDSYGGNGLSVSIVYCWLLLIPSSVIRHSSSDGGVGATPEGMDLWSHCPIAQVVVPSRETKRLTPMSHFVSPPISCRSLPNSLFSQLSFATNKSSLPTPTTPLNSSIPVPKFGSAALDM